MAQLANLLMDAGQPVVIKYNTLVQATTGYTSISVAGAANVTLTNNQASHAIVELTGVLTGNIQVIVPAREKPYVFLNNTTGAFTLTVKTAAGSGPAISQAAHTSVYCNGTNVIQVSASVATSGAPADAQYLVAATHVTLTAERAATDTATISWDFGTAAQGKANIVNASVTYTKLQDASATARILARITAGAGSYEEASLTQVLDLVGSAAQGDILFRGSANWTRLAAGVDGEFLKTRGAGVNPIWDAPTGTGSAPIGAQYIVSASDASLTAERVATDTATINWSFATPGQALASVIAGSITYGKIQDAAVTARILARISAGAGSYEEATLTQVLDLVGGTAQGDVLFRGVSNWTRLAAGVDGEFLKSQGPGANPQWGTPIAGDSGAPIDAQYIVSALSSGLSAERVATDTGTINWSFATPGQALASIVNASVTYGKLQDASVTARILARITAGAGSYEEATLTQVLDLVGSAAQGDILYRGSANWTRLAAGTADEFLQTRGAGVNPRWFDPVPAGSVTYAKLQNASTTSRILARRTAGAGSYEETTLTQILDFTVGTAHGDIIYRGATTWNNLPAGVDGEFLKSQGAGANPQWSTPLSGLGVNKVLYATSATAAGTDASLHWDNVNNWLGIGVATPEKELHVRGADGVQPDGLLESYITATGAPAWGAQHARGTAASPAVLISGDAAGAFTALGWARNAGDTANAWVGVGRMRGIVDSVDAQNRIGGRLIFEVSAGVSAGLTEAMRVTQASNLLLGATTVGASAVGTLVLGNNTAPTTSPANIVQLWCADLDGVAGKAGLHVMGEMSTTHIFAEGVVFNKLNNGQRLDFPEPLTEVLTIAAAATSTSTITIPINAVVFGVSVRVTVAIPTATTFTVGVSGAAARYGTGISVAANTTNPGTNDATRFYGASTAITITPSATPATNAGRVRISIFYYTLVPPTA